MEIWIAAISGIFGIIIGTAGTIYGQHRSTRATTEISHANQRLTLRADRRAAIYAFLEAAQTVDMLALHRHETQTFTKDDALRSAIHQLWYRQKCVEVICGTDVHQSCVAYSHQLDRATRPLNDGIDVWDFMKDPRDAFLRAAKTELDASDLHPQPLPVR